jgi:hypothetical protein
MLKHRLKAEGEHIVEIIGVTILPHVHNLAPGFPFPCLLESFGESKEGKVAQQATRAAVAHIITEPKRRVARALPKSCDPGPFFVSSLFFLPVPVPASCHEMQTNNIYCNKNIVRRIFINPIIYAHSCTLISLGFPG